MDKRSLLRKSLLLFILFIGAAQLGFSQQRTITGKVTDATDSSPLPGVTVRPKEVTNIGTVTQADGTYSLEVPAAAKTLIFSSVGYNDLEVPISGTTVNAQLEGGQTLNEVVVIGYGTQKAKDVTGAVASINATQFNKGIVTNPIQQVQGKVSGLVITQPGGDPNQSVSIRLRGQASLTGGQSPLIVVDGIPLSDPNQLANIPPGDIASYDVLKDASAAAIYGSRAANGVIIINTKKGQAGKMTVNYNGYIGMANRANKYDLLNAADWKRATELVDADPADYDKGGNTDWQDAISRTAVTNSHNLSISGGTDQFTYRASGTYINQQGIVINTGKDEVGLRFNAEQKALNDKLDIQLGIMNTQTNRKYADYTIFDYVLSSRPIYPIYNEDGSYYGYSDFAQQNPVAQQMLELNTGKEKLSQLYGTINYEIIPGLKIGATGSLSYFTKQTHFFQPTLPAVGNLNNANQRSENWNTKAGNIHINYQHSWDKHNFSLTLVHEYNDFLHDYFYASGEEFLIEDNRDNAMQNGNSAKNNIESAKDEYQLASFLGRVTYNYNSKYYITASLRRDGSSKFGINNRWGNFPSVSVAWRMSEEDFLRAVPWINELKISAGYGVTGNQDAIDPYRSQLLVGSVGRYYDPSQNNQYPQAYAPTQNANPDLKWEEVHGKNIALDFALFKSRLTGNINVYNNKTENLLYNYTVPVPPFYVNTILANVGELTNKGVEIQLSADIIKTQNFNWSVNGQIAFSNTKVVSLSGTYAGYKVSTDNIRGGVAEGRGLSDDPITYLKVGYSPYVFYLLHFAGVNAEGTQLFDSSGVKITDNSHAQKHYIDPSPKFHYGFGSTLSYKNWSLNFFLRGVYGQKIFDNTHMVIDNLNARIPGNNATYAVFTNGIKDSPVASDLWLENASYMRLDNFTLAYTFNKISFLKNLQLYISGNNLFVITPYKGLDPEIRTVQSSLNNSGVENQAYIDANYGADGYYPKARSFSFGINVSFQ